ncbi:MAG: LLM class F420-dependent oxidoreductase [Pseudomonadota bacterium]
MEYGVHLPHLGRSVSRAQLTDFAQTIEALGAHSGWVSDHVAWPRSIASRYPYSADGSFAPAPDMGWLDPIGTQLFVAGVTERLRLGFTVLILPYRPPVVTAKQLATLDVLSEGRLILGCGVGWMREEAEILGMPWDRRGARADEQLDLFQTLFTQTWPSFDGEFYSLPEVGFEPKPIQDPLPIWIGGSSPAAFERAGRVGHGFHAAFQDLDTVQREWQAVSEAAQRHGRDPNGLTLSLRLYLDPAGAMNPAHSIAGSPSAMRERIDTLEAAGVQHVLLDPVARGGVAARLTAVETFLTTVDR